MTSTGKYLEVREPLPERRQVEKLFTFAEAMDSSLRSLGGIPSAEILKEPLC